MLCGMFGKLPSKRDFVSYNLPRPFLEAWDGWLQTAVASSKHALGQRWQDVFLTMPLWRFWFGSQVFGQAASGVLMPSVDGVGRYFPLSICACKPQGGRIPAPPNAELEQWLATCEALLLRLLDEKPGDDAAQMLAALPFAPLRPEAAAAPIQRNALQAWTGDTVPLATAFEAVQASIELTLHDGKAYWWTEGGGAFKPHLAIVTGKPDPMLFTSIMTGSFG